MINKDSTLYDVVGIGNAIVDVLAKVGDGFLRERSLPKGGMTLVEAADAGKSMPTSFPNARFPAVRRPIPFPASPRWAPTALSSAKSMTTNSDRNSSATSAPPASISLPGR